MPQWSYAVVVLSQVSDQPIWLVTSEGDAPVGLPNPARSPWEVLPLMGKEGWELVDMTRTDRVRGTGPYQTLDLVFKRRS